MAKSSYASKYHCCVPCVHSFLDNFSAYADEYILPILRLYVNKISLPKIVWQAFKLFSDKLMAHLNKLFVKTLKLLFVVAKVLSTVNAGEHSVAVFKIAFGGKICTKLPAKKKQKA